MIKAAFIKIIVLAFISVLIISLFATSSFCEIQIITINVKQTYGGSQSADDARITAMAKAKREALEMAGTYIESLTVVKDQHIDKDEILALSAGVLKADVVSQKNYHTEDAFGIEIVVNVVVDTSVLEKRVKKLLQDRTHLAQLKETQKREKELLQKVAQLEVENRKLTAKKQSTIKLKKQFQQVSQSLKAVEWFYKALATLDVEKYNNPRKAVQYFNNAIKLDPDYADAYLMRGLVYGKLGQHQREIRDYTEVIRLKPDYAEAYYMRGIAYHDLDQYQRAIKDYSEAIRMKPDYAFAYRMRGNAYIFVRQYERAIEDCNEVIRLKPDYIEAYIDRGFAYDKLGQQRRAIEHYNEAIRMKPDYAYAYYLRGIAYGKLGQHQRAFDDFNQAIRLKPDYATAYSDRGVAYFIRGDNYLGCRDAQKACELGDCKLLETAKGKGACR